MTDSSHAAQPARAAACAALALACAFLLSPAGASSTPSLLRDAISTPGPAVGPSSLVESTDLNLDGRPDLLVLSGDVATTVLTWYLAQADGTIQQAGQITTSDHDILFVQAADVTGEGYPDLIVSTHSVQYGVADTGKVWVYPGDGAGHFGAGALVVTGTDEPVATFVKDFDGDGKNDLLLTGLQSHSWRIARGLGGATFADYFSFPDVLPAGGWGDYGVADVTGDGRPDVLAREQTGLDVFNPPVTGGVVSAAARFLLPHATATQAEGDLDGDGIADICLRLVDGSLYRVHSLGGGNFDPQPVVPVNSPGLALGIADVDGDGKGDILMPMTSLGGTNGGITMFRSPGAAAPLPPREILATNGVISGWWLADENGDGRKDIVTAVSGSRSTAIEYHVFSPPRFEPTTVPVGSSPGPVAIADLDGDGKLDVAVAETGQNDVAVLLGDGSGGFAAPLHLPAGPGITGLAAGRLTAGGGVDLVTTETVAQAVFVYRNLGAGTFAPRQIYPVGKSPLGVAIGDLDGDGFLDLVTADNGVDQVTILHGDGSGGFPVRTDLPAGYGVRAPLVRDIDNDGRADLVYALEVGNAIAARLQQENGTLGPEQATLFAIHPQSVAAFDMDRDGVPLLAAVGPTASGLVYARRNADGTYTQLPELGLGPAFAAIAAADLNGDGIPDLATVQASGPGGGALAFVPGGPSGAVLPTGEWSAQLDAASLALGDLNGDARPDLVVSNRALNTLTVFMNRSTEPIVGVPSPPSRPGAALAITRLAPNPSRGGVVAAELSLPADGAVTARVVSLAGRALWEHTLFALAGTQRVAVAAGTHLAPGVYWLDVRQGPGRAAQKFVVLP